MDDAHPHTINAGLMQWQRISIAPKDGSAMLIHYKNSLGKSRIIKAMYVSKFSVEANWDSDDIEAEYNEAQDAYYWPEGWYEQIDNWPDYSGVVLDPGNVPDAWMPLPQPPTHK